MGGLVSASSPTEARSQTPSAKYRFLGLGKQRNGRGDDHDDSGSDEEDVDPEGEAMKTFEETEKIEKLQEWALKFLSDTVFYGIPVRSNKRAKGHSCVYWVEPLPNLIEEALAGKGVLDKDLVQLAPTGALVDRRGGMKIYFAHAGVEYALTPGHTETLNPQRTSLFCVIPPKPPKLKSCDIGSLTLSWYKELPMPAGFIQTIEVQYSPFTDSTQSDKATRWQALLSKSYHLSGFFEFVFGSLPPGREYVFRMRYLSVRGWSDYSQSSPPYSTLPAAPDVPAAPQCTAITCYAVELTWTAPERCNGAEVTEFILQGRGVGDDYVELYRGRNRSYLALGLFPQYAYSFQLAAVNALGASAFSAPISIQTPSAPTRRHADRKLGDPSHNLSCAAAAYFSEAQLVAATGCRDAWCEFWDPRTERAFYFNSILATRQLEVPDVLKDTVREDLPATTVASPTTSPSKNTLSPQRKRHWQSGAAGDGFGPSAAPAQASGAAAEESKGADKLFRVKRYRLLRALHRRRTQLFRVGDDGRPPTATASHLLHDVNRGLPADAARAEVVTIPLRRDHALEDCLRVVNELSTRDLQRRFKFSFVGETGIDSGGLTKDAYLVVSRACVRMAGPRGERLLMYTRPSTEASMAVQTGAGLCFHAPRAVAPSSRARPSSDGAEVLFQLEPHAFGTFLGRFLAKAILDRQLVDLPLSGLALRQMLGVYDEVSVAVAKSDEADRLLPRLLSDLRELDGEYHQSMVWILEHDITDVFVDESFVVETPGGTGSAGGGFIPLCANGEKIRVTEQNKREYVFLLVLWKIHYSVAGLLVPFLEAFHALIPQAAIDEADLSAAELGLVLWGKQSVSVEELRAYCIYQDEQFSEFHESAVCFWRAMREFDDATRRRVLHFFTGSARVPLDGYDPPLNLTLGVDMEIDSLPRAHTCFNQLVLPNFSSYDVCKARLVFAVENCDSFELA